MYRSALDIYEMFDTLSLEMNKELFKYLKADIAAAKASPKKCILKSSGRRLNG